MTFILWTSEGSRAELMKIPEHLWSNYEFFMRNESKERQVHNSLVRRSGLPGVVRGAPSSVAINTIEAALDSADTNHKKSRQHETRTTTSREKREKREKRSEHWRLKTASSGDVGRSRHRERACADAGLGYGPSNRTERWLEQRTRPATLAQSLAGRWQCELPWTRRTKWSW